MGCPILRDRLSSGLCLSRSVCGGCDFSNDVCSRVYGGHSCSSEIAILCNRGVTGNSVFTALRHFCSTSFFGGGECVCICAPSEGLACRVISTFRCSGQRVVGSFSFSSSGMFSSCLGVVGGPRSISIGGEGARLAASSGVLILDAYLGDNSKECLIRKILGGSRPAG